MSPDIRLPIGWQMNAMLPVTEDKFNGITLYSVVTKAACVLTN
jgi:hypothetical protein